MAVDRVRPTPPIARMSATAAALAAQTPAAPQAKAHSLGRDILKVGAVGTLTAGVGTAVSFARAHSGNPEATSILFPNPEPARLQLGTEMRQMGIDFMPPVKVRWESYVSGDSATIHLNRLKFSPVFRTVGSRAMEDTSFMHLIRHEAGHAVYDAAIKPSMNARFKSIFGSANRPYKNALLDPLLAEFRYTASPHFVSKYAQVHPAEDFAETFGVFTRLGGNRAAIAEYVAKKGGSTAMTSKFDFVETIVKAMAKLHPA